MRVRLPIKNESWAAAGRGYRAASISAVGNLERPLRLRYVVLLAGKSAELPAANSIFYSYAINLTFDICILNNRQTVLL
jgi:hypothetical protein